MLSKDTVEVMVKAASSLDDIGSSVGDIIKRCGTILNTPAVRPDDMRFHATAELKAACQGVLGQIQILQHVVESVKTYASGTESL